MGGVGGWGWVGGNDFEGGVGAEEVGLETGEQVGGYGTEAGRSWGEVASKYLTERA